MTSYLLCCISKGRVGKSTGKLCLYVTRLKTTYYTQWNIVIVKGKSVALEKVNEGRVSVAPHVFNPETERREAVCGIP